MLLNGDAVTKTSNQKLGIWNVSLHFHCSSLALRVMFQKTGQPVQLSQVIQFSLGSVSTPFPSIPPVPPPHHHHRISAVVKRRHREWMSEPHFKKAQILGAIVRHAGAVWRGCCWSGWLLWALDRILRPVELTQILMEFVQFSWQRDSQFQVKREGIKPVFQLLERWTMGGGGGEKKRSMRSFRLEPARRG